MPSVLHLVVTNNFAGTERYVTTVANETARRDWDVTVVGGDPARMRAELGAGVTWRAGATLAQAAAAVIRSGRQDVVHVHMTAAEAVGAATRRFHRGRLVSTRHFAQHRGASLLGGVLAPWIGRHLSAEIAISQFVADRLERPPTTVIHNGVPASEVLWRPENRFVLVLQRLEPEKDTETALRAWAASGLAEQGWRLRVVGDGSERDRLELLASDIAVGSVEFVGHVHDVRTEFTRAGMLLAPAPTEPFGLSVVEAMAAGVPVVAAGAGAHCETSIGAGGPSFSPGDALAASAALISLAGSKERREGVSHRMLAAQRTQFTVARHVDRLLGHAYARASLRPQTATRR